MAKGYFVTGTDTGVGKTEISLGLMAALQGSGYRVLGMKPVAAGCSLQQGCWVNEDALRLQCQGSLRMAYEQINPYALEPAIAPHLAAAEAGIELGFERILTGYRLLASQADWVVVEGAGGWRVPLGADGDMADLASALGLPVVLVVGLRLGCINHSLLTLESVLSRGVELAGWVANRIDPAMERVDENIHCLLQSIPAPCFGVLDWLERPNPEKIAGFLSGY